jgi:tetratricopeptide (TPR) repeat protein
MVRFRSAWFLGLFLAAQSALAQEPPRADPLAGKLLVMTSADVPVFVLKDGKWQEAGKAPKALAPVRQASADAYRVHFGEVEGWVRKKEAILLDDAAAFFSDRIKRDPKDAFAYRQRGIARSEGRYADLDGALADLDEAVRLQPADPLNWRHRGMVQVFKRDYDRALTDFDESIRLDPNSADAYTKRCLAWSRKGMNEKILVDIEEAIRREPHNADHYCSRALAWFAKGDKTRGWADLEKAVEVNPEVGWVYTARAKVNMQFGSLNEAVADLDRAIALEPNVASWYVERSRVQLLRGDDKLAHEDIDRALKLDPTYSRYYQYKAELFLSRRMWDEAMTVVTTALKVCPDHKGELYGLRSVCALWKKDYRSAIADLDSAVNETPGSTVYQATRADLLATCPDEKFRDYNRAIAEASRIAEQGGNKEPELFNRVALYCTLAGRTEDAERWRAKAKALAPPPAKIEGLPPLPAK